MTFAVLGIMKKGFSLVELVIVVALLGIMAAIVVPQFQSQSARAKKAVAQDHLRILRSSIELYTVQHRGVPPGYENDNPLSTPSSSVFLTQMMINGSYFRKMPANPYNNLDSILMVGNYETFPGGAVDGYGWIYQPATKNIRLSWSGTDSDGLRYLDY